MEGESFSVNCSYKPQEHENGWISWCKKQENGEECGVPDLETSSKFSLPKKECFSSYDHDSGILTITMSELRVNDSGVYECVIHEEHPERQKVLRRLHLMVSPVKTQNPYKRIQTTSEITYNNHVTNRSSTTPLGQGSPETKFLILGVVLSCLLLSILLVVGILCARRIYQKARKGDDSESWGEKSKGSAMKMDSDENAEEIHYATVTDKSPQKPTNAKIRTPVENVEYATITRN
ncbi:trem-like transcript 4 protein [Petaurus breviceps papuanus]|uniref:trem-like transcript 4 protein n=1 Tax=Petaurus breviceps papuanus TaxID=3040969 RepID=UPI0036DD3A44